MKICSDRMFIFVWSFVVFMCCESSSWAQNSSSSGHSATVVVKPKLIEQLARFENLRDQSLMVIDRSITETLKEAESLDVDHAIEFETLRKKLKSLIRQRREVILQKEFYELLRIGFREHFVENDVKAFLQIRLTAIAQGAIGVASSRASNSHELAEFCLSLKAAIVHQNPTGPQRGVNLIEWIESYVKTAPILSQANPVWVESEGDYQNGNSRERARPTSLEEAGDYVDQLGTVKK